MSGRPCRWSSDAEYPRPAAQVVPVTARLPRSVVTALDTALTAWRRRRPEATRRAILRAAVLAYLATEEGREITRIGK